MLDYIPAPGEPWVFAGLLKYSRLQGLCAALSALHVRNSQPRSSAA